MTTRVETFRAHCARMSKAEHKPECPSLGPPPRPIWEHVYEDGSDMPTGLAWLGNTPSPPTCDGCLTDADRALFARLAAEAAAYQQGELEVTG